MILPIILLEVTLLWIYFLTFEVYFLLSLILVLFYVSWYTDGNESTGFRQWSWLRQWSFGIKTEHIFGANISKDAQYLFVAVGNESHMGMIGGFGLHKNELSNLCYMMPAPLFRVPVLRDFLLWTGAVSDQTDLIVLLKRGWNVAMAPGWMQNTTFPDVSIFEFAMRHGVHVVPVEIAGDSECFRVLGGLERIQQWSMERTGWPFPFLCFPRCSGRTIKLKFGMPMDARVHKDAMQFREHFLGQLKRFV